MFIVHIFKTDDLSCFFLVMNFLTCGKVRCFKTATACHAIFSAISALALLRYISFSATARSSPAAPVGTYFSSFHFPTPQHGTSDAFTPPTAHPASVLLFEKPITTPLFPQLPPPQPCLCTELLSVAESTPTGFSHFHTP